MEAITKLSFLLFFDASQMRSYPRRVDEGTANGLCFVSAGDDAALFMQTLLFLNALCLSDDAIFLSLATSTRPSFASKSRPVSDLLSAIVRYLSDRIVQDERRTFKADS